MDNKILFENSKSSSKFSVGHANVRVNYKNGSEWTYHKVDKVEIKDNLIIISGYKRGTVYAIIDEIVNFEIKT